MNDRELITRTVLDDFEGWYDGDVERIGRALHPWKIANALWRSR